VIRPSTRAERCPAAGNRHSDQAGWPARQEFGTGFAEAGNHAQKVISRITRAGRLLAINPRIFMKLLYRRGLATLVPRPIWFRILESRRRAGWPLGKGDVVFPAEQGCPHCGMGPERMYEAYRVLDFAIRALLFGCCELDVQEVLRRFLKPGDTFLDVGAQIGYFTALGADLVGEKGEVHCFEPEPSCQQYLRRIASLNLRYRIVINPCGCGEAEGRLPLHVTEFPHLSSHTFVPEFAAARGAPIRETIKVPIIRLDNYILEHELKNISLIKIDVEGFEGPVLRGLEHYFVDSRERPAILVEMEAHDQAGLRSAKEASLFLARYGYEPFDHWNPRLRVTIEKRKERQVLFRAGTD
jgi:FkbM family methyltransferase